MLLLWQSGLDWEWVSGLLRTMFNLDLKGTDFNRKLSSSIIDVVIPLRLGMFLQTQPLRLFPVWGPSLYFILCSLT